MKVYEEIITAYERHIGRELSEDPYVYQQLVKIMDLIKEQNYDLESLKDVVTNAIILLLSLFFNKKPDDDFDDNQKLTPTDQKMIRNVLNDAYNVIASRI